MDCCRREQLGSLAGMKEPVLLSPRQDAQRLVHVQGVFDVDAIARTVGLDVEVRTLDVISGHNGPRWTLAQWALYFKARCTLNGSASVATTAGPMLNDDDDSAGEVDSGIACNSRAVAPGQRNISRQAVNRVLVVPYLSLHGASVDHSMQVHSSLKELSLIAELGSSRAKGEEELHHLHVSIGPASPQQPYQLAPCGGYRWLQVQSGAVLVRLQAGTDVALASYAKHQQTLGHTALLQLESCPDPLEVVCSAGQALIVPAGWLASFEFQAPSITIGGYFWRADALQAHLQCCSIERGLRASHTAKPSWFVPALWSLALRYTTILSREASLPALEQRKGARKDLMPGMLCPGDGDNVVRERVGHHKAQAPRRKKPRKKHDFIERDEEDEDEADFVLDNSDGETVGTPSSPLSSADSEFEQSPEPETTSKRRRKASKKAPAAVPSKRAHSPTPDFDSSRRPRRRAPPPVNEDYVYAANDAESSGASGDAAAPPPRPASARAAARAAPPPVMPIARVVRKPGLDSEDDWDEEFGKGVNANAVTAAAVPNRARRERDVLDDDFAVEGDEASADGVSEHDALDSEGERRDPWDSDASLQGDEDGAPAPTRRSHRSAAGARLRDIVQAELDDEDARDVDDEWDGGARGSHRGPAGSRTKVKVRLQRRRFTEDMQQTAAQQNAQAPDGEGKTKIRIRIGRSAQPVLPQTDGAADTDASDAAVRVHREAADVMGEPAMKSRTQLVAEELPARASVCEGLPSVPEVSGSLEAAADKQNQCVASASAIAAVTPSVSSLAGQQASAARKPHDVGAADVGPGPPHGRSLAEVMAAAFRAAANAAQPDHTAARSLCGAGRGLERQTSHGGLSIARSESDGRRASDWRLFGCEPVSLRGPMRLPSTESKSFCTMAAVVQAQNECRRRASMNETWLDIAARSPRGPSEAGASRASTGLPSSHRRSHLQTPPLQLLLHRRSTERTEAVCQVASLARLNSSRTGEGAAAVSTSRAEGRDPSIAGWSVNGEWNGERLHDPRSPISKRAPALGSFKTRRAPSCDDCSPVRPPSPGRPSDSNPLASQLSLPSWGAGRHGPGRHVVGVSLEQLEEVSHCLPLTGNPPRELRPENLLEVNWDKHCAASNSGILPSPAAHRLPPSPPSLSVTIPPVCSSPAPGLSPAHPAVWSSYHGPLSPVMKDMYPPWGAFPGKPGSRDPLAPAQHRIAAARLNLSPTRGELMRPPKAFPARTAPSMAATWHVGIQAPAAGSPPPLLPMQSAAMPLSIHSPQAREMLQGVRLAPSSETRHAPATTQLRTTLWKRFRTWCRAGEGRQPPRSCHSLGELEVKGHSTPMLLQMDGAADAAVDVRRVLSCEQFNTESPALPADSLSAPEREQLPLLHWFLCQDLKSAASLADIPDAIEDPRALLKQLKVAMSACGLKPISESELPFGLRPETRLAVSGPAAKKRAAPAKAAGGSSDASVGSAGQPPAQKKQAVPATSAPGVPVSSKGALPPTVNAAKPKPKVKKVLSARERVARMK